ncbi:ferritin-like domain-containing protein [Sporomusa ovata]|uniref:Putative bacterioferritin n=1 Tax=Sporomusa ovata TaxID=2378 RepID=A0A0U1KTT5_9FIRM|nr:manganese catalase family protein [Sporomusa ovata]EQB26754.1 Mn-containing catalase [Sporomusa ovata DSM 2662]CQR70848.1 putative bacterioferritin [Sporomusa ovata]
MSESNYDKHKRPYYSDPSPYPEIRVVEPNLHYARLLMDDYAGVVSEFTAISQYLYHYFFSKNIDEKLGKLFENVSINEMLHMEILADIIIMLGGDPQIRGSFSTNNQFWNGKFIYYGDDLCEQLKADIEAEYTAIEEYRKHIQLIDDHHIQAILKRIILDEKVHIRLFNKALFKFCGCTYREGE